MSPRGPAPLGIIADALRVSLVGIAVLAIMAIPAGLPGSGVFRPRPPRPDVGDLVSDYELMMRRWRRAMLEGML